jgi:hypothetical protein
MHRLLMDFSLFSNRTLKAGRHTENRKDATGQQREETAMQIIEHTEGHYEAQDVEFGRVYRWNPETVEVACDCGERLLLTGLATTCDGCGADHAATVRGGLAARRLGDEALHPWRYAKDREGAGVPY